MKRQTIEPSSAACVVRARISCAYMDRAHLGRVMSRIMGAAASLALILPLLATPLAAAEGAADQAAADLECANEPISGSGPGFSSSRDASEEAAIQGWLEKAKAVYPEATWEAAKDAGVACAVQGLYSKCFAQGTPCRPKGAADDTGGADDTAASSGTGGAGESAKTE